MFEDSMMESGGKIKTKTSRWMIVDRHLQSVHPGDSDPDSAAVSGSAAGDSDDGPAGRAASSAAPSAASAAAADRQADQDRLRDRPGPARAHQDSQRHQDDQGRCRAPTSMAGVAGMAGMGSGAAVCSAASWPAWAGNASSGRARAAPKPTGPQRVSSGRLPAGDLAAAARSIRRSPRPPMFREWWCCMPSSPSRAPSKTCR